MKDIDVAGPTDDSIEDNLGGLTTSRGGSVFNRGGRTLINDSGKFVPSLLEAKNSREETTSTLWDLIGPLEWGDVEIDRHTHVWDEENERWLSANTVDIYGCGTPRIRFLVVDSDPTKYVEFDGEQIAERVSSGTFSSLEEVDPEIRELLEG